MSAPSCRRISTVFPLLIISSISSSNKYSQSNKEVGISLKMVKVAIAGASGGVGRAIIQALEGRHELITLTRPPTSTYPSPLSQNRSVEVDYNDVEGLTQVLQVHAVHTVICAISLRPDSAGVAQLNLIRAAEQSTVTKRFIPSEFSIPTNDR